MSLRTMTAVFYAEAEMRPAERLLLLAYADQANDIGIGWPSNARLARKTGMAIRTVQRHKEQLIDKDLLEVLPPAAAATSGHQINPRTQVTRIKLENLHTNLATPADLATYATDTGATITAIADRIAVDKSARTAQ